VPIPPEGTMSGMGRIPVNTRPEFCGHPVWWLDEGTRRRQPGEPDYQYGLRLWFEVLLRGWIDAETTLWYDFLLDYDIDTATPVGRERLAGWLSGHADPMFSQLVLNPPDGHDPTEAGRLAAQVVAELTPLLDRVEAEAMQRMSDAVEASRTIAVKRHTLDGCGSGAMVNALHAAQLDAQVNGQISIERWETATNAVWHTTRMIDEIYEVCLDAAVPLLQRETSSTGEMLAAIEATGLHIDANATTRRTELAQFLDAIRAEPTRDEPYAALMGQLTGWHHEAHTRLSTLLTQVDMPPQSDAWAG
jgi:hypothetical protein